MNDLIAYIVASIEGANWTDHPLTEREKACIEMAVQFVHAQRTDALADFARRCRAYLDDAPGSGGHSDAAGSNAYELIEEAIAQCCVDTGLTDE